jgi:exosortase
MTQPVSTGRFGRWFAVVAFAGPLACLLWAYWTTLAEAASRWSADASYSHGYLVPLFAVALLWLRREYMPANLLQPNWLGLLLLAAGIGLRLFSSYFFYVWLDPISLLPCLAGIVLLIGGWPVFRWAWPSVLFLAFMIPLPYRYAGLMARPLQEFATVVSTFLLQALGVPALAEGTVILLSEVEMGIVEACSGLRMLVVFFALSTAVALLMKRPIWEKWIVVASAVPIALACNVLRITATGVLHEHVSSEVANAVFHDFAGWLMMPLGLGMLWLEQKILVKLWLDGPTPFMDSDAGDAPLPAAAVAPRARRPWKPAKASRHAGPNPATGAA